MKNRLLSLIALQILIIFAMSGFAKNKVLIIAEQGFYNDYQLNLLDYTYAVEAVDHKKCEIIPWQALPGTNVQICDSLLQRLQSEYVEARNAGDILEGAVLIGDVPVPQYNGGYGLMPIDQVYMDIVDTGNAYAPYSNPPYHTLFAINGDYYSSLESQKYTYTSDNCYDIWISRINAAYLWSDLREGLNVYDEYWTYARYLNRVLLRMNEPATVPSRGFYMGGPESYQYPGYVYSDFGTHMNELHLPWLAEFSGGHHSPFNWVSQLLAGPRGCINYGGFNGTHFPETGRNKRYCLYDHLPVVYPNGSPTAVIDTSIDINDTLGWEWAGLLDHGCPVHQNFFSNDWTSNFPLNLNGNFQFATLGPPCLDSRYRRTNGGNGGSYYVYQDSANDPNPFHEGFGWREKGAEWRWLVTSPNDYNIYLYYEAPHAPDSVRTNCDTVYFKMHIVTVDGAGLPQSIESVYLDTINQRTHFDHLAGAGGDKWERLFGQTVYLGSNQMAIVEMQLNDDENTHPGFRIVDAVRFIPASGGAGVIVDDAQPTSIPDATELNNPSHIFSTTGFHVWDDVNRAFEDIGSEPGGGGFSKTQFFMTTSCNVNDFTYSWTTTLDENLGNLYALGYNGLISFGTSEGVGVNDNKTPFTSALRNGNNFGQASLIQSNSDFFLAYVLLGAGTLRAIPYVQFGSTIFEQMDITSWQNDYWSEPILIRNVTVNGDGDWQVTSCHNSWSPFGAHAEIVVRPETVFSPTGTNEVHLQVLNQ